MLMISLCFSPLPAAEEHLSSQDAEGLLAWMRNALGSRVAAIKARGGVGRAEVGIMGNGSRFADGGGVPEVCSHVAPLLWEVNRLFCSSRKVLKFPSPRKRPYLPGGKKPLPKCL